MKKESLLEKILIGATGSIVASAIWQLTITDINYDSLSSIFTSEVNLPVWTLILISAVVLLVVYINYLNKKHYALKFQVEKSKLSSTILKTNGDEEVPIFIDAKDLHYKIGKRVITLLKEDYPRKASELTKLIVARGEYSESDVEETIDELVQNNVLDSTLAGGFKLHTLYDTKFKRAFSP